MIDRCHMNQDEEWHETSCRRVEALAGVQYK